MSKSNSFTNSFFAILVAVLGLGVIATRISIVFLFFLSLFGWYSPDAIDLTNEYNGYVPEFWTGLYHGASVMANIIRELWCDPARIYSVTHGGYYELGFAISVLGILSFSSSDDKK